MHALYQSEGRAYLRGAERQEVYGMRQDEETLLALCVFRSRDVDISLI
jgi:hypothetical protein